MPNHKRKKGSRQGKGNASINTIQERKWVYLKLLYLDPQGVKRAFPVNFPVVVRYGADRDAVDGVNTVEHREVTTAGGALTFPARLKLGNPWRSFTLRFGADHPAAVTPPVTSGRYIWVEEPGQAQMPGFTSVDPVLQGMQATTKSRFFLVPNRWSLRTADWSLNKPIAGNGKFDAATAQLSHTVKKITDIGTRAAPVELLLDPHWHFLRFEYFDRYFGPTSGSPPRSGHGRRVSIPPLIVEGFRFDPNADLHPETRSNWTVDDPSAAGDTLQCVPFILRKEPNGTPISPPISGTATGFRFQFDGEPAWVYSQSKTVREIKKLAADSPPVARPSAKRLKYYDLPSLWKSRGYYTRDVSPAAGFFYNTLSPPRFQRAEATDHPLIFSLDDAVLCSGSPPSGPVEMISPPVNSSLMAIFSHRFIASPPGSTTHGIYKPQPHAAAPTPEYLPRSNTPAVNNYVYDYPDWTRLIAAQGDLFDVFDQRTPDRPTDVVGARAAMRWKESMAPQPGLVTLEWSPPLSGWIPAADSRPIPRRRIDGVPARVDAPFFNVQHHFQQFPPRWQQPYNGSSWQQGRFDLALLRCCDYEGDDEVAINLHYLKSFFDFAGIASPPSDQRLYAHEAGMNVANRWNGHDAVSIARGVIVPSPPASPPGPASPPFKAEVVWFAQSTPFEEAHFEVTMVGPGGRDNRWAQGGRGESSITGYDPEPSQWFPLAHESGHMNGLPDEYNERWDACSYGQLSFKANLPGDPYEPDGRDEAATYPDTGMMNGNRRIRNRYFWHAAEWIREITGTSMAVNYRDASGTDYDGYWLPPHPQASNQLTYYCHPVAGLRDQPPGDPWTQCDVWLYALGKDQYTANPAIVPHASPPAPYDGILLIALRLACTLSGSPPLNEEVDLRENALSVFAAVIRNDMNFRFAASGTAGSPPIAFQRCLIHFVPQFLVENYPYSSPPRPSVVAGGRTYNDVDNTALAARIRAAFGLSFFVHLNVASPPAVSWSPPAFRVDLDFQTWNDLDNLVVDTFPGFLDMYVSTNGVSPPAVQTLLGQVFPGGGWTVRDLP